MRQLPLRLPLTASLEDAPELASIAILDVALVACEGALLAANLDLFHGQLDGSPRNAQAMRAHMLIVQARRLGTALAVYREAVDRDARRRAELSTDDTSDLPPGSPGGVEALLRPAGFHAKTPGRILAGRPGRNTPSASRVKTPSGSTVWWCTFRLRELPKRWVHATAAGWPPGIPARLAAARCHRKTSSMKIRCERCAARRSRANASRRAKG